MFKSKVTYAALIAVCAFALGLGVNNAAFSDVPSAGVKIAVVDVNKVVASSSQVKALKQQQDAKKAELQKWLDTVKADIQKQSSKENKEKLVKKYDAEFGKKAAANKAEYTKQLQNIDKNISSKIKSVAEIKGYSIVLSKSSVLYGGEDITSEIIKTVK